MRSTSILAGLLLLAPLVQGCSKNPQDYYPLGTEHSWKYRFTVSAGGQSQNFDVSQKNLAARDMDGKKVVPQETSNGQRSETAFFSQDGDICQVAKQSTESVVPQKFDPPRCSIKGPVKAGTSWTSLTDAVLVQREANMSYRIESIDETVTAATGNYTGCLKVVGTGTLSTVINGVTVTDQVSETYWYANGVGMVKATHKEDAAGGGIQQSMNGTVELVEFK